MMSKDGVIDQLKVLAEFLQRTGDREQLAIAGILFSVMAAYQGGSIFDLMQQTADFTERDLVRLRALAEETKTQIEILTLENMMKEPD